MLLLPSRKSESGNNYMLLKQMRILTLAKKDKSDVDN